MRTYLARRFPAQLAILCTSLTLSQLTLAESATANNDATAGADAEQQERNLKLVLGGGISFGGDDLAEAEVDGGFDETIEAGSGIDLRIGASYYIPQHEMSIQATVGYFSDSIDADNGDASITRHPAELLALFHHGQHRFGAGLAYYFNNSFDIQVDGFGDATIDFDDTTGFVAQYAYEMNEKLSFAVRGSIVEYSSDELEDDINGNHVGFFAYVEL